jgi:hypothetical protein
LLERCKASLVYRIVSSAGLTLPAIAQNLRRLAKLMARSPPAVATCVA